MNKKTILNLTLITVFSIAGASFAMGEMPKKNESHDHSMHDHGHDHKIHEDISKDDKAIEVGNKICPVSGEENGSMGAAYKVEHEGKIYNLCCKMCAKSFQKDPKKFISEIDKEMNGFMKGSMKGRHHDHSGHDHGSHNH